MKNNEYVKSKVNLIIANIVKILVLIFFLSLQGIYYIYIYEVKNYISYAIFLSIQIVKYSVVGYIFFSDKNNVYKLTWTLLILIFPVSSLVIYYIIGNRKTYIDVNKKNISFNDILNQNIQLKESVKYIDIYKYNEANSIKNMTGYNIYASEHVTYLKTGEDFFNQLKLDLINAKKYIFLQFYIISDSELLEEIIQILELKILSSVEVIVIYDALGSRFKLSKKYINIMKKIGVKLYKYNPYKFDINKYLNYRDHSKMCIIDGMIAYTGGINIGDEYINTIEKYGYFKDNGIKVTGQVVNSFILMFLKTLEQITKENIDFSKYILNQINITLSRGYISAFKGSTNSSIKTYKNIYINALVHAKKYIYITTPYIAIDNEIIMAFENASLNGVDVRLIVPKIPDKKIINKITKSYYEVLLKKGVRIYEYTPGFIHQKTLISDDDFAIVGTINLDFRSLDYSFENGLWMYKVEEINKIKKDIVDIITVSEEIYINNWKKRSFTEKITEKVLNVFSPII